MTKVYPGRITASQVPVSDCNENYHIAKSVVDDGTKISTPTTLTVWKKSLLFNCEGFTVIDAKGNLVYRVDNYISRTEIVLMDASGNSLLTIRRKKRRLGMVDNTWLMFNGDATNNPTFEVRKNTNLLSSNKCLAHVSSTNERTRNKPSNVVDNDVEPRRSYTIEGSYCRRSCGVYDEKGTKVAEIKQKEAPVRGVSFGMDIFTLVIQPGVIDTALAMALVVLLDQMYGSSSTSRPFLLTNFKSHLA